MANTILSKFSGNNGKLPQRLLYLLFFVFSFLLYANTIFNDYNLDDELVTRNHRLTSKGVSISSIIKIFKSPYYEDELGYSYEKRPIVHLSFAIEHAVFGEKAWISHLINILLYALSIVVLFKVLQQLFSQYAWWLPIITVLLFAAHPIHTEVVASIKNRDEILAFFFCLLAFDFVLRFLNKNNWLHLLLFILFFLISLLSKRTAVAFIFIIPFALILFTKVKFKQLVVVVIPLPIIFYFINPIYVDWIKWSFIAAVMLVPLGFYGITKLTGLKSIAKNIVKSTTGFFTAFLPKTTYSLSLFGTIIWFILIVAVTALGVVSNANFLIVFGLGLLLYLYFFTKSPVHKWWPVLFSFIMALLALNYDYYTPLLGLYMSLITITVFYKKYSSPRIIFSLVIVAVALGLIYIKIAISTIVFTLLIYLTIVKYRVKFLGLLFFLLMCLNVTDTFLVEIDQYKFFQIPNSVYGIVFILSILKEKYLKKKYFAQLALIVSFVTLVIHLSFYPKPIFYNFSNEFVGEKFNKNNLADFLPFSQRFTTKQQEPPQQPKKNKTESKQKVNTVKMKPTVPKPNLKSNQFRDIKFIENPIPYQKQLTYKVGTIINTLGQYLKLHVYPHPLSFYYGYNQIEVLPMSNPRVIFYLSLYLALLLIMFIAYFKWRVLSFAIFIYLVAIIPFANIFSPVAGIVGERLAFIASLGYCLAIAWLIITLFKIKKTSVNLSTIPKASLGIIVIILIAYSAKTASRNSDWKSRATLFNSDIKHLTGSAQAYNLLASNMAFSAFKTKGEEQTVLLKKAVVNYNKALDIYPYFLNVHFDLGRIHVALGQNEKAANSFYEVFKLDTTYYEAGMKAVILFEKINNYPTAISICNNIIISNPLYLEAYTKLSFLYYQQKKYQASISVNEAAINNIPNAIDPYLNLAQTYLIIKQPEKALPYLEKATQLNQNNPKLKPLKKELNRQLNNG